MNKMRITGNSYFNDLRKPYSGMTIPLLDIHQVAMFAHDMCFGEGHHRNHRSGGQVHRKAGEQFCNTFQGKLAEVCLRKSLISLGLACGEPDFEVYGEGIWDDTDLVVNSKSISVKSAAYFSNLLLLETKDYDSNGNYLPNLNIGSTANYDFYVLVRINPDIKSIFRRQRLMYSNDIPKETLLSIIREQRWSYDIAGWISHAEFVEAILAKHIIPQNALLNGKLPMDASNYYIQSGDMHDLNIIANYLK